MAEVGWMSTQLYNSSSMNQLSSFIASLNLLRIFRFALGVFMGIQAIHGKDVLAGILSAVLLWQAWTNAACCGVQQCSTPQKNADDHDAQEVKFEEVRSENK